MLMAREVAEETSRQQGVWGSLTDGAVTDGLSLTSRDVTRASHHRRMTPSPLMSGSSSKDDLDSPLLSGSERSREKTTVVRALLYGVINAIVVAPVMIGFAAIIFRHPAFHKE